MYYNYLFVFFAFANIFFAFFFIVLNEVQWVQDMFFFKIIPGSFRYWTLMIVMGNSLATYLFEKIIVYKIQVCNQRRQETKRLSSIESEMKEAREDLDNYFKLKS